MLAIRILTYWSLYINSVEETSFRKPKVGSLVVWWNIDRGFVWWTTGYPMAYFCYRQHYPSIFAGSWGKSSPLSSPLSLLWMITPIRNFDTRRIRRRIPSLVTIIVWTKKISTQIWATTVNLLNVADHTMVIQVTLLIYSYTTVATLSLFLLIVAEISC